MAQLMAYQAAKESAEDYEPEIARREALAERVAAQQQAEITFAAHQAALDMPGGKPCGKACSLGFRRYPHRLRSSIRDRDCSILHSANAMPSDDRDPSTSRR